MHVSELFKIFEMENSISPLKIRNKISFTSAVDSIDSVIDIFAIKIMKF